MTATLWGNILIALFISALFYFIGENLFRNRPPFVYYVVWAIVLVMIVSPPVIGKGLVWFSQKVLATGQFFMEMGSPT